MSAILFSSHQMLAAMTKIPELGIKEIQARTLGEAIANVARHYDTQIDQKNLDWFNLFQVSVLIYGPVIAKIAGTRKARRGAQSPEPAPEAPMQSAQPGFVDGPARIDLSQMGGFNA